MHSFAPVLDERAARLPAPTGPRHQGSGYAIWRAVRPRSPHGRSGRITQPDGINTLKLTQPDFARSRAFRPPPSRFVLYLFTDCRPTRCSHNSYSRFPPKKAATGRRRHRNPDPVSGPNPARSCRLPSLQSFSRLALARWCCSFRLQLQASPRHPFELESGLDAILQTGTTDPPRILECSKIVSSG